MSEPYHWEHLPRDGDYVGVSVCHEDECITDEPMGVRVETTSWGSSWMDVERAQSFSSALEQAIIHASGDPIQGALARIRGALETLREAGMGEMGEAYVLDALDKMGMGETAGRWVKSIDKIVLQEEDAPDPRDRRFKGAVEVQGKQYPMSEGITIEVQLAVSRVTPIDRMMGTRRAALRQYTARWEGRE